MKYIVLEYFTIVKIYYKRFPQFSGKKHVWQRWWCCWWRWQYFEVLPQSSSSSLPSEHNHYTHELSHEILLYVVASVAVAEVVDIVDF